MGDKNRNSSLQERVPHTYTLKSNKLEQIFNILELMLLPLISFFFSFLILFYLFIESSSSHIYTIIDFIIVIQYYVQEWCIVLGIITQATSIHVTSTSWTKQI